MQNQEKQAWHKPSLEVLEVNMTAAGAGIHLPDSVQPDPTEVIHYS